MAVKSLAQSSVRQAPPVNTLLAGYQPNAFHHLETVRLGGSAASVEFTNLARYSDYQHLQIRAVARTTRTPDTDDYMQLEFNATGGSNYAYHNLSGNGSTVSSGAQTSQASMRVGVGIATANSTANAFSSFVIDILDPYEAKNKTVRTLHGRSDSLTRIELLSGVFMSTTAVSSIKLFNVYANFAQYSRFSLYGIKARA